MLALSEEKDPRKRGALYRQYCRGWFVGSSEARKALSRELASEDVYWVGPELKELKEVLWEKIVKEEMKVLGKRELSIHNDMKGAAWKVTIAKRLRKETTASNPWIAKCFNMGHPNRVSNLINDR